jgi:hypothetical protein
MKMDRKHALLLVLVLVLEVNYCKYDGVKALGSCQTDGKQAQFELNKQR